MRSRGALRLAAASLLASARAQQPQDIPFNTSASAGPNGPWNFISLQIGSGPLSSVDFFPMLSDQSSMIVANDVCSHDSSDQCPSPRPGYYDTDASSAKDNPQNIITNQTDLTAYDGGLSDQLSWSGSGHYWVDNVGGDTKASNVSFFVATNIIQKDGTKSYKPLSLLSLEPNADRGQVKTTSGNASANTILGDYTDSTKGGSSSFSLHYGSAAFNQSGSLVLGGYDPSRLIEPPAVFSHLGFVRLNTISFGASSGTNPWSNSSSMPQDFLGAPADVLISPHDPHIYLAQDVCNLMAQYLPIQYDDDTNLYLWNTSSPAYHDIVTSPSYLNFTFGDALKTTIRVPFALLNLTMTSPLKDRPTQYFPCSGRSNVWNLGRAFLQSAFLMQSYDAGSIAVAQAPGPYFKLSPPPPSLISVQNPTVKPYSNAPKWADTWQGILTPLGSGPSGYLPPANTDSSSNSTTSDHTGLTSGAIAGIVIGAIGGVAIIIAAVLISHHYRKKPNKGKGRITTYDTTANSYTSRRSQDPLRSHVDHKEFGTRSLISRPSLQDPYQSTSAQRKQSGQYPRSEHEKILSPTIPGSPQSRKVREIYITRSPHSGNSPRNGSRATSIASPPQVPASIYGGSRTGSIAGPAPGSVHNQSRNNSTAFPAAPTSVYSGRGHSARVSNSGPIHEYLFPASANRSQTPLVEIDCGREIPRGVESVELDSRPHSSGQRFELPDSSWNPPEMGTNRWSGSEGGHF